MNIRLTPAKLHGTLPAVSSKSDAHRVLIASALAEKPTKIFCNILSDDIRATAACLAALGAKAEFSDGEITVHPNAYETPKEVSLDCGESGSTLRFLLPLVSVLGKNGTFIGHGRLPKRPVTPLREAMEAHGVRFPQQEQFPLRTEGQLSAGDYTLRGDVSSQYITGLLFSLPLLEKDSTLTLLPPVESLPYIRMTLHTLRAFGIEVHETAQGFRIPGNQTYHSPREVTVEGDWSNAAFFLVAGALGDSVTVTGLRQDSEQGDKAIVRLLFQMGAKLEIHGDAVTVSPAELHGVPIDGANIPDLVPVLSVAAAAAKSGVTVISNAARLRLKECDRLSAVNDCLSKLGAAVSETDDGLVIWGGDPLHGGQVSSYNDHRMAMAMAVASIAADGPVVISGAEAVAKSYPHFFEDFNLLGGKVDVLNSDR